MEYKSPIYWTLVVAIFTADVNSQLAAVSPPIVGVNNEHNNRIKLGKNYDVTVRKYSRVSFRPLIPVRVPVQTTTEGKTSTTTKRAVEDNEIDIPTQPSTQLEETLLDGEECAFSFILPNPLPRNQQVCVKHSPPMSPQMTEDDRVTQLQEDVSSWQSEVQELRNQIAEQPPQPDMEPMENEIKMLQKESRNMNFRVSQLYMQLLHEIIRKRDDTIEFTSMENNVLNVTVKYYELKDKHEALLADHEVVKQQAQAQQEQIGNLQEKMELMINKINKINSRQDATQSVKQTKLSPAKNKTSREEEVQSTSASVSKPVPQPDAYFTDCTKAQKNGHQVSGEYSLKLPTMSRRMKVWCDFDQDPGGWTVIQRRSENRVNFYRNMASYQRGFGMLDGDFWLGLENMHQLTTRSGMNYKLHIDMEDWNQRKTFVEYRSFKVEGEDDGYRLKIAHYSGTAGDALTWHNNMKFTAKNVDNDPFVKNCANYQRGGWWYNMCAQSNLNGIYYVGGHYRSQFQDGIYWSEWRGGSYSLKKVEMKIRPSE